MSAHWQLVIAGTLVGLSVGLTGMGGGALMTPVLVLAFGVDPAAAVGSDLLASAAMKPVGAAVHHRAGTVRWELVRWLVPAAVPAAFAGAFLMHLLGSGRVLQDRLRLAIGAVLLAALAGMAAQAILTRHRAPSAQPPGAGGRVAVRPARTLLIGLAGGLVVGMTSVGAGALIIVMLMLTYPRLRAADLVGTNLVQAIPLAAAAALGHLLAGDVRLALSGALLLGALPGVYLGARLATQAPGGLLKWILAVLLLGSGLELWHVPAAGTLAACAALAAVTATLSQIFRLHLAGLPGRRPESSQSNPGRGRRETRKRSPTWHVVSSRGRWHLPRPCPSR